ncbi:hypothetical protein MRX96_028549 [Rhipicephalus microplus]
MRPEDATPDRLNRCEESDTRRPYFTGVSSLFLARVAVACSLQSPESNPGCAPTPPVAGKARRLEHEVRDLGFTRAPRERLRGAAAERERAADHVKVCWPRRTHSSQPSSPLSRNSAGTGAENTDRLDSDVSDRLSSSIASGSEEEPLGHHRTRPSISRDGEVRPLYTDSGKSRVSIVRHRARHERTRKRAVTASATAL